MEIRKVQELTGSLFVCIPAAFADEIGLQKEDCMKAELKDGVIVFKKVI